MQVYANRTEEIDTMKTRPRKTSFRSKVESEMEILDKDSGRLTRFFLEERHVSNIKGINEYNEDKEIWRKYTRERMKTVSVALVFCLHIGVDPPDPIPKPNPCAKLEGWVDPFSMNPQRALAAIAASVQKSYERWQPRARYKMITDPTTEDVKKLCLSMRRNAKDERVLFHYNGHGVPRPTSNGEIWVFNKTYTQYIPLSIFDLQSWMESPSIYVWDCNSAETIINSFNRFSDDHEREWMSQLLSHQEASKNTLPGLSSTMNPEQQANAMRFRKKPNFRECIHLAGCRVDEKLPLHPQLPADLFTSCLTTPIQTSILWYLVRTGRRDQFPENIVELIPGSLGDRRTVLGELNWIFTAITDTIAWNLLPKDTFQRLFRQDLLLASLFRSFILAEKIMGENGCTVISQPILPSTADHPLWESWDYTLDQTLRYLYNLVVIPEQKFSFKVFGGKEHIAKDILYADSKFFEKNNLIDLKGMKMANNGDHQHSWFFIEQLDAFEVWLEYCADKEGKPPQQLPIVLQVLLSQTHRLRALELLARFLDLGQWAVIHSLTVGVFPYVQKLLQSNTRELRPWLSFIWAKILAVDPSCQVELFKENGDDLPPRYDNRNQYARPLRYIYFLQILNDPDTTPHEKIVPAFILAMLFSNNFKIAQENLTTKGYVNLCTEILADPAAKRCTLLKLWVLIGLGRLWADYDPARWQAVRLNAYEKVKQELDDPAADVRAAACYAIGCLIKNRSADNEHASFIDQALCDILCEKCSLDGAVLVRVELAVALHWYIMDFEDRFAKLVITMCDKLGVNMLETEQAEEEQGFDIASTIVKPNPSRTMAKASDKFYQTLRPTDMYKKSNASTNLFQEEEFKMTEFVTSADESFRIRAMAQIRYLEGKSFSETVERVWLAMLRLALDAHLKVASMAKVMVLRIEEKVVEHLQKTNEKIAVKLSTANLRQHEKENLNVQVQDNLPDGDQDSIMSGENEADQYPEKLPERFDRFPDRFSEATTAQVASTSSDNHSVSGGVLFVVGSPATGNSWQSSKTPETPLAPPVRKLSMPASMSSQRSTKSEGRAGLTREEAMKLLRPAQLFTPKRIIPREAYEPNKKKGPVARPLQEAVISSEFVEWCSRIFVHPILDAIQSMAESEGQEENEHSVRATVIPTDWAYHTKEGLGQVAKEEFQMLHGGERCEHSIASVEAPNVSAIAMSTLRKILYFTDGRKICIMRFERRAVVPRKFPAYGGNPFCADTVTKLLVINDMSHEMLIAGSDNGIIRIWDPAFNPHSHEFNEEEPKLVSASPIMSDLLINPIDKDQGPNCLYSWSQNSGKLACAGNVKCVRIWSAENERTLQDVIVGTRWGAVTALSTELDESHLVTVGFRTGAFHVHDLRIPSRASRILRHEDHAHKIISCQVTDQYVTVGNVEGKVSVFDPRLFHEPVHEFLPSGVDTMSAMDVHSSGQMISCVVNMFGSPLEAQMPKPVKTRLQLHNEVKVFDMKGKNLGNITSYMVGGMNNTRIGAVASHKIRPLIAVADDNHVTLFSRKTLSS